jgi:4-amino-4-deoxy-L-arabinose transferase-like glycosyltransferase
MKKLWLPLVLFLAFLLRVIWLDKIPTGFTPDEASFGYDAYSILKTGEDQWGHKLPLILESSGDFKSPLYAYITIPFVAVLGLNEFATRLPNALLGLAAVYITYLLVRELTTRGSFGTKKINPNFIATIASLLLAISPWHVMMSRGAFEANLTTFFLTASLFFLIKGIDKPKNLMFGALFAGLNIFTYHSAKFVTPLVLIFFFFLFRKELVKNIGKYHIAGLSILALSAVIFLFTLFGGSSTRIANISIFKLSLNEASSERIKAINMGLNPTVARLFFNKYEAGLRHFAANYTSYFSPQFYFISGPSEGTYGMIPGRGVLYWFELPILIFSFLFLIKNFNNRFIKLILFWFLISPIPAALSLGPGYAANRAVIQVPSIQILLSFGIIEVAELINRFKKFKFIIIPYVGFALLIFVYFLLDYFLVSPMKVAKDMLYGSSKAAYWLKDNGKGKQIVVSRTLSSPHIYIAFANKTDPDIYHEATKSWNYRDFGYSFLDQMPIYYLENYTFGDIDLAKYGKTQGMLLVGKPEEFQSVKKNPLEIIYYPNGDPAISIFETPVN